jgi:hypothetical protein
LKLRNGKDEVFANGHAVQIANKTEEKVSLQETPAAKGERESGVKTV